MCEIGRMDSDIIGKNKMSSVAMEEYEVMKEAKYRLYVSAVDKALKAFESTNEWPDLISALGKLNKVLKDNQRYPVIPRRIKISKRLAQCTHFALPAGVHLKALETYDTIFKCMGTNRLSHELFIYSAGLFPLFGHSAMNVKPLLLTIYETHFVPLGPRLRPGLSGFLSGVLPGLEEGSDHFDRTNSLLEKVCDGVGTEFFYSCLWECVCYNSGIRLPAVSFVLSHFNKKLMMEEQKYIMGNNLKIMVNALCAGVQDANVLVQRSSLDLLLVAFPMHSDLLEKSSLVDLVTSAITTVLRRDMSLNRRLYAWLLGSDLNISQLSLDHPFLKKLETLGEVSQSALYFDTYSKENLIQGVQSVLKQENLQSPDIRPYRLLMSLLDKQDVGPVILDNILYEVFRTLCLSCREDKFDGIKSRQEILKSANLLFSSLEPWYIWLYMGSLFDRACEVNIEELTTILEIESSVAVKSVGSGQPNIWEVCELCEFLLGVIPLEVGGDDPSEYLLHLILHIVGQLTKYIDTLSPQQTARCLKLCTLILSKIQPFSHGGKSKSEEKSHESEQINAGVIRSRVGGEKRDSEDKTKVEAASESGEPGKAVVSAAVGRFSAVFKNFLKQYEIFYMTLVGGGRIVHSQLVSEAFESMKKNPDGNEESNYAKELRRILTAVMNNDDTTEVFNTKKNGTQEGDGAGCAEVAAEDNEKWEEAFGIASEILVGLSSFPVSRIDFDMTENRNFLPWMKFVVVCACRLEKSPALQLIAIKTLLDLLSLSKVPASRDRVMALLNNTQAEFLEQKTHVLEILSRILWKHLGGLSYHHQVQCIELLYQLHGVFESDESLERVVGDDLLRGTESSRVKALRRFIKLWNIGREIQSRGFYQIKLFHKCLLKVLDNLLLPDNMPLKIETQTCLVQSLIKGDLPRLLDPVLLMLLDPATARMSILHVSIQHSVVGSENQEQNCQTDENSNKIYAISSIDGNVIYHVSNALTEKGMFSKKLKWRWKNNGKTPCNSYQRSFSATSLKDRGDCRSSYVTSKNIQRDIELPSAFEGNMSVLVNPFSRGFADYDVSGSECTTSIQTGNQYDSLKSSVSDGSLDRHSETDVHSRQPRVTLEVTTTQTPPGELWFFGQLKNKLMDIAQGECEDSHSADEYFNNKNEDEDEEEPDESTSEARLEVVNSVLGSLVDIVVKNSEDIEVSDKTPKPGIAVHPYHSHFLLYCGVYDSCRTIYALNTLKNIILTNSRLFLCCAASSGIVNAPFASDLITLLARHKKSVLGRNFHGGEKVLGEYVAIFRSNMFLEILVSICLHFARSYYPNLGVIKLTADEIAGNRQVQLTSVETLTHMFSELIPIVRDSGKGFANYIADMLNRCKVQKTVLYCLMVSLLRVHRQQTCSTEPKSFTEEILDFNDPEAEDDVNGTGMTEHSSSFQIQLLKALQTLVMLEQQIDSQKVDSGDAGQIKGSSFENGELESKYTPDSSIPNQPMFMKAVVTALSLKGKMRCLHYNWTELITSSLPYLGTALSQVVMVTINQICSNLEELAVVYLNRKSEKDEYYPPGYAVTQLEALTVLCHFCILDSSQQVSPQPFATSVGANVSGIPGSNPAQILSNLVHVFTSSSYLNQDSGKMKNQQQTEILRKNILSNMPRIISSISALWQAVTHTLDSDSDLCIWGNPKVVRNQILGFLSPISVHHGPTFLAAVAVTWEERKNPAEVKKVLPVPSPDQQILVNLVSAIRVMPIDTLVQTVHQVVKQPPALQGASPNVALDVSTLELFYAYMQTSTSAQLGESWNSLLSLLRDGLLVAPPALFLVLAILNEYVQKCPSFQDKKNQRDLQDITSKLVETCGNVAGACLEPKSWLGRNLAVKEDLDVPEEDSEGSMSTAQQYSVQAQLVLAQILAPLLDVSYGSQEKDKVAALLTNLMNNITPYLKSHLPKNAPSFAACSQLLANLSGFQYTRKAWKREVFELLLEPSLFQMDINCLSYWTTIIDNLMTHDITSFRDLLSKVSMSQGGSYTLFSSREQEYEQRSQLLKRLAFVIFCSETDQYHKFMSSIQEKLSEILRLPQVVPSVQAQVFLCFRILLLRMSSHQIIGLWPILISEMVQVFTLIEQELCTDSEEFNSHIKLMSALDSSWVANSSNGLHAHGHPHWLQLILAAAKLLDLVVLLPTHHLPHFQMYRWAFVSDASSKASLKHENGLNGHDFVPHVMRICRLMNAKYGPVETILDGKEGQLLLDGSQIDSLQQLHSFFASVGLRTQSTTVDMESVESCVLQDFLEKIPTKGNH